MKLKLLTIILILVELGKSQADGLNFNILSSSSNYNITCGEYSNYSPVFDEIQVIGDSMLAYPNSYITIQSTVNQQMQLAQYQYSQICIISQNYEQVGDLGWIITLAKDTCNSGAFAYNGFIRVSATVTITHPTRQSQTIIRLTGKDENCGKSIDLIQVPEDYHPYMQQIADCNKIQCTQSQDKRKLLQNNNNKPHRPFNFLFAPAINLVRWGSNVFTNTAQSITLRFQDWETNDVLNNVDLSDIAIQMQNSQPLMMIEQDDNHGYVIWAIRSGQQAYRCTIEVALLGNQKFMDYVNNMDIRKYAIDEIFVLYSKLPNPRTSMFTAINKMIRNDETQTTVGQGIGWLKSTLVQDDDLI